jgi:hypothetical protein
LATGLAAALVFGLVMGLVTGLAATPLQAQGRRQKEIRVDLARFLQSDGNSVLGIAVPGSVALGIYLNRRLAIEPQVAFNHLASDGANGSLLSAGLFVPYYLKGDSGHSGLFVSPGILLAKGLGDFKSDLVTNYGIDVGLKRTRRDVISGRLALFLRDGDSYTKAALGAVAGVGLFWR